LRAMHSHKGPCETNRIRHRWQGRDLPGTRSQRDDRKHSRGGDGPDEWDWHGFHWDKSCQQLASGIIGKPRETLG
jgi:hypothetical protein